MPRGRPRKPRAIKVLLGNPGHRLPPEDEPAPPVEPVQLPPLSTAHLESMRPIAPDYLNPIDKQLFDAAVALLPPGVARKTDMHAFARWAHWLNIWVQAKQLTDGKAHWYEIDGKLIEHPISRRMQQAEENLVRLEDRLALNITSRNSIVHRLFMMPSHAASAGTPMHPQPGGQPDDPAALKSAESGGAQQQQQPDDNNPLGFLERAGRLH